MQAFDPGWVGSDRLHRRDCLTYDDGNPDDDEPKYIL